MVVWIPRQKRGACRTELFLSDPAQSGALSDRPDRHCVVDGNVADRFVNGGLPVFLAAYGAEHRAVPAKILPCEIRSAEFAS